MQAQADVQREQSYREVQSRATKEQVPAVKSSIIVDTNKILQVESEEDFDDTEDRPQATLTQDCSDLSRIEFDAILEDKSISSRLQCGSPDRTDSECHSPNEEKPTTRFTCYSFDARVCNNFCDCKYCFEFTSPSLQASSYSCVQLSQESSTPQKISKTKSFFIKRKIKDE